MKNKGTIKKILLGLVIAIIVLAAYAALNSNVETSSGTSSLSSLVGQGNFGQVQETDTALANAEILRILGSIENITLNDDIFSNPIFRELEDSRFTIPDPTQIGRPNPFLPIGFDSLIGTSNIANTSGSDNQSLGSNDSESSNFFTDTSA